MRNDRCAFLKYVCGCFLDSIHQTKKVAECVRAFLSTFLFTQVQTFTSTLSNTSRACLKSAGEMYSACTAPQTSALLSKHFTATCSKNFNINTSNSGNYLELLSKRYVGPSFKSDAGSSYCRDDSKHLKFDFAARLRGFLMPSCSTAVYRDAVV